MRADKEGVELFPTQKTSSEWRNTHKTFELVSNFSVATTKARQCSIEQSTLNFGLKRLYEAVIYKSFLWNLFFFQKKMFFFLKIPDWFLKF